MDAANTAAVHYGSLLKLHPSTNTREFRWQVSQLPGDNITYDNANHIIHSRFIQINIPLGVRCTPLNECVLVVSSSRLNDHIRVVVCIHNRRKTMCKTIIILLLSSTQMLNFYNVKYCYVYNELCIKNVCFVHGIGNCAYTL